MTEVVVTAQQSNRLREDVKRAAHIHRLVELRTVKHPIEDEELKLLVKLMSEEYDVMASDLDGLLTVNGGHEEQKV